MEGKTAVDQAIRAGVYREHVVQGTDPSGKSYKVQMVGWYKESNMDEHEAAITDKASAGGRSSEQEFRNKLADTFGDYAGDLCCLWCKAVGQPLV